MSMYSVQPGLNTYLIKILKKSRKINKLAVPNKSVQGADFVKIK